MFYLSQFFKLFLKSPLRGFFFLLFSFLLVLALGQRNLFENEFVKLIPENKSGASFYALIAATESHQRIVGQMQVLPGVHKVETLSEAQIKSEVKEILGNLEVGDLATSLDLNYVGMKVVYVKGLMPRAQELVRDYLMHLVSEGNITLGAIKDDSEIIDKRAQFIGAIKTWGYSLLLGFIFIFWSISLLALRVKIEEASYLLESYQRKKRVSLKMALNGIGVIFILAVGSTFLLGMPQVLNLAIACCLFIFAISLHLRKLKWENN